MLNMHEKWIVDEWHNFVESFGMANPSHLREGSYASITLGEIP